MNWWWWWWRHNKPTRCNGEWLHDVTHSRSLTSPLRHRLGPWGYQVLPLTGIVFHDCRQACVISHSPWKVQKSVASFWSVLLYWCYVALGLLGFWTLHFLMVVNQPQGETDHTFHLVLWLRMNGAIYVHSCMFSWCVQVEFYLYLSQKLQRLYRTDHE